MVVTKETNLGEILDADPTTGPLLYADRYALLGMPGIQR